ncbi:MAG: ABC transporter ATP-binding protein [Bacteriovoracia bacterium]
MHGAAPSIAVEFCNVTKRFGDVVANHALNLRVTGGTVHAIVGENGAGKSTAMKLLYGEISPTEGEIRVEGQSRTWRGPADAIAAGIGMVYQHFTLAGPHTVLENIILGVEPGRFGVVDRGQARARIRELSTRFGLALDPDAWVEDLSVGEQQRVEILKLLYRDARILILDEPTAVLTPDEVTAFFANLRRLKAEGKTILLITHKLKEVMAIADEVTVISRGRVATGPAGQPAAGIRVAATSIPALAELMVGHAVDLGHRVPRRAVAGDEYLRLDGVTAAGRLPERVKLADIGLSVRASEIVGVVGVEGNGQRELVELLVSPRECAVQAGKVSWFGEVANGWRCQDVRKLDVALIPEDRHYEGLLMDRPVYENYLLGRQRALPGQLVPWPAVRAEAAAANEAWDVRPRDVELPIRALSGGNQQKVIIAREFARKAKGAFPRVIIAAKPTRGVDIGAIESIHARLIEAREAGSGILLVTSELEEAMRLADRIVVMYGGRIVARFDDPARFDEKSLGLAMAGAAPEVA